MYKDRQESFGAYLARRRKEWGFSYEQLTEGLCGTERAFRIEKEKREPYKTLKDRLLARVGVSPDVYENFLFGSDYDSWKLRQQICGAIMKRDGTHAKKLLAQYKELCGSTKMDEASKRLEQQFLLSMEGQLGRLSGESEEKLAKLFWEALELTVPEPDGGICGKALSVHELNLLLEHLRYSQPDNAEERYREILAYIEGSHLDELSRARIYPKTVCYLYHYTKMIPPEKPADAREDIRRHAVMLRLCNQSIELLQNTGRMYYLWELLSLRENAVKKLASALRRQGAEAGANNLSHLQEENNQLLRVLEQLYEEYGISPKTEDFCFLYDRLSES